MGTGKNRAMDIILSFGYWQPGDLQPRFHYPYNHPAIETSGLSLLALDQLIQ